MLCDNLSDDLVVEILSRILATSLVKFKSVCRSWLELIGDPSFVVKHHQTRAAITNNGCFVSRCYSDKYKGSRWWFLYRDGESADVRHEKIHPPYPNWKAEICAAANGIFYIHSFSGIRSEDYYLWNPSTRESTSVTHRRRTCTQTHDIIGLGFDFKSGYVKVLRTYIISARERSPTSPWTSIAKAAVWTSRDGCWRELDNVSPLTADMRSKRKQIYVRGRCYWYVTTAAEKTILCFDIVDEKFGLLPLPATVLVNCEDPHRENMIIELKQSLGIVCFPPQDAERVDIWLMSHELHWSKYLTLRVSPRSIYTYCPLKLFFMERDVIFVDLEGYFFFQNLSTEKTNFFRTNLITKYSSFAVYNESIISFKVKDSERSRLEREIKNCPKYFRSRLREQNLAEEAKA